MDIGNHRLKWAFATPVQPGGEAISLVPDQLATGGADWPDSLKSLGAAASAPQSVWIASVAGADINDAVRRFVFDTWQLEARFLASVPSMCGIQNAYTEPGTLGVDRWAAMVGACARAGSAPVLVIDAGTAVTIDYVGTDRIFRGGVIFPGLHAMFNALHVSTARIRAHLGEAQAGELKLQNPDTRAAVDNGVRLALAGAVSQAVQQFRKVAGQGLQIFITGGDAAWFRERVDCPMIFIPALVLEGVHVIATETDIGAVAK